LKSLMFVNRESNKQHKTEKNGTPSQDPMTRMIKMFQDGSKLNRRTKMTLKTKIFQDGSKENRRTKMTMMTKIFQEGSKENRRSKTTMMIRISPESTQKQILKIQERENVIVTPLNPNQSVPRMLACLPGKNIPKNKKKRKGKNSKN